jgi:hypothetical protein
MAHSRVKEFDVIAPEPLQTKVEGKTLLLSPPPIGKHKELLKSHRLAMEAEQKGADDVGAESMIEFILLGVSEVKSDGTKVPLEREWVESLSLPVCMQLFSKLAGLLQVTEPGEEKAPAEKKLKLTPAGEKSSTYSNPSTAGAETIS